ncbi:MAG: hypothetical protein R2862_02525 [Thermoanaerobaculia bacterium]
MTEPGNLSVPQVVAAIRERLGDGGGAGGRAPSALAGHAAELQRRFRSEPVGGRLVGLKRIVYWFVASAFDRQGKVVEAALDELAGLSRRIERIEQKLAQLEKGAVAVDDAHETEP